MNTYSSLGIHFLLGRLGNDPEPLNGGQGVRLSLALQEFRPGQNGGQDAGQNGGQDEQITHWIDVVIWGEKRALTVCEVLRKGDMVATVGQISTSHYTPKGAKDQIKSINFQVPPGMGWWRIAKGPAWEDGRQQGAPEHYIDHGDSQEDDRDQGRRYDRQPRNQGKGRDNGNQGGRRQPSHRDNRSDQRGGDRRPAPPSRANRNRSWDPEPR